MVYNADVLEGFFGWVPSRPIHRYGDSDYFPVNEAEGHYRGQLCSPGTPYFSPHAIGVRRYRSTMATLWRSCRRLKERGLIDLFEGPHSRWSGLKITDKGREWLSANPRAD